MDKYVKEQARYEFSDLDRLEELSNQEKEINKRKDKIDWIEIIFLVAGLISFICALLLKNVSRIANIILGTVFGISVIVYLLSEIFKGDKKDIQKRYEQVSELQKIFTEFDIAEINIYADREFVQIKYFDENGILQKYEFVSDNVFTYNKNTVLLKGHCVNDDYLIDLYIPYSKE